MNNLHYKINKQSIQISGLGLFSKEPVVVSIEPNSTKGITFVVNKESIASSIDLVSHTGRNTVLGNGKESICLVEHFLAACSLMGVDNVLVKSNKNELIFNDGSAIHWKEVLAKGGFQKAITQKHDLKEPIMIKDGDKAIAIVPASKFKVSYFMDFEHPALGKLYASWGSEEDIARVLRARTFGTKIENDFFGVSGRLLTLLDDRFNMELYEPNEPVYHKILDIIGDLRLSGINPLEINMHVFGYKSGHTLNAKLARKLKEMFSAS
ncbi:MAG: UDP-3-O-acyl-N-acetylglucosamine deacetylase [Candidatus Melainabacteria bacterium]|nr:UDP-3-O-acyl-N-acetylglucosamine deacetylase [Candidatus Melainabacteria bacterium]